MERGYKLKWRKRNEEEEGFSYEVEERVVKVAESTGGGGKIK